MANGERPILFRGKRIDNGEWEYGDLFHNHDKRIFIGELVVTDKTDALTCDKYELGINFVEVDPDTVGQFTGMTDKNGKKIFEGDIVKVYEDIDYRIGRHKSNRKTRTIIGVVVFDKKRFEYQIKNKEYNLTLFRLSKKDTNEIIGNIHDNPELVEVTDNA